jgi:hypothetical protein
LSCGSALPSLTVCVHCSMQRHGMLQDEPHEHSC